MHCLNCIPKIELIEQESDYDESENPRVRVKMDSGVNLPKATDFLLEKGITGF